MHLKQCRACQQEFSGDGRRAYCDPCRDENANDDKPVFSRLCESCSADVSFRHHLARFCLDCADSRRARRTYSPPLNDNQKARVVTNYAVKVGFLPPPTDYFCMDCGADAECYDHRDYKKPLEVDPVCLRCNSRRGRGEPLHAPVQIPAMRNFQGITRNMNTVCAIETKNAVA